MKGRLVVMLLISSLAVTGSAPSNAAERAEIPENYTWNLSDIFPSVEAWKAAKAEVEAEIPRIKSYRGTLGNSAASLHQALSAMMAVDRDLNALYAYAMMRSDEDLRDTSNTAMRQELEKLWVDFAAAVSWVRPEILSIDAAKVRGFIRKEPKLAAYEPYLDDILRWKPHTLSPEEEKIAAMAQNMADAGGNVHGVFTNAEMPYPEVTLSTGETVRLDAQAYTLYRAAPNREDREKVFDAFWNSYNGFRRTFATTLYERVKAHEFNREVHNFGSSLEAALFRFNIPVEVYRQLISDVHANLDTLHRYLDLRKRLMGVDKLGYEDLYTPIVDEVDLEFTPEEARDLTLDSSVLLGEDYVRVMRRGYNERWVDFMPSTGKRSGAYSAGVYGVHPYQLQNFMGRYDDVSTLAHEFGHSMHTYLSDTNQPYPTHDYSTFVAEVASTLNENLLFHHMLDTTQDDEVKLFLMGSYLENARQTLFRQTLFAEFELRIHEMVERGETLTGDNLNALYLDLLREYYGHEAGTCEIADLYAAEWAYIHHFYYNFYVYQYATSYVASTSIATSIREEEAAGKGTNLARDAYLEMLSSGSSKYPIDLLKGAGVDMTTSAPFNAAIAEMNRVMDMMEEILEKRRG